MNTPENIDPRAKRWGVIAKYAALLGVGFVVAPYIFTAITGLVGLIVAGVIMLVAWMLLPTVETAARNLRLKLLKAEAARNPIETLQNEYLRRDQALTDRKNKIERLAAKTAGFGSKLAQFKRDYPADAQAYQDIYDKMVLLAKRSRDQWILAEAQLKAFDREIDRAKAKWEMAIAADGLRQDAGTVEAEFLAKLKVESSLDAIELGMNTAFAQLDTLLMESEAFEINVTGTAPKSALAALPAATGGIDVANPTATKTTINR
jgi:hypothetical protein